MKTGPNYGIPIGKNASDQAKGISLLFGILFILTIYGLAEAIKMLFVGRRASLIELVIFTWLVTDAIVLFMAVREKKNEEPGPLQYMSVWILGLIPYFGWLVVYWIGKRIAGFIEQHRSIAPTIALFLFTGIIILCIYIYLLASPIPVTTTPVSQ